MRKSVAEAHHFLSDFIVFLKCDSNIKVFKGINHVNN